MHKMLLFLPSRQTLCMCYTTERQAILQHRVKPPALKRAPRPCDRNCFAILNWRPVPVPHRTSIASLHGMTTEWAPDVRILYIYLSTGSLVPSSTHIHMDAEDQQFGLAWFKSCIFNSTPPLP